MRVYKIGFLDLEIAYSRSIKKKLKDTFKDKYLNGNEEDRISFIRIFQIYQSRFFCFCFFRSKTDDKTWKEFFK